MCTSTPKMPAPAPPPQEVKQPDAIGTRRRTQQKYGMGAGTMLTSPSGVASGGPNLGSSTLLGG
jgi:hypothetical protein